MENQIHYLIKDERIYSLFENRYSCPLGICCDILFFDDYLVLLPSDKNSKELATSAIGKFLPGLLIRGSTMSIDTIVNKYKSIKFDKSLPEKLENTSNVLFCSYPDISCTIEEEKRPAFMSFIYAQNTWVCFSGTFRLKERLIHGRIAYRETGSKMKDTIKKLAKVKSLKILCSDRKVLIDDYLDDFLIDDCEGERMSL